MKGPSFSSGVIVGVAAVMLWHHADKLIAIYVEATAAPAVVSQAAPPSRQSKELKPASYTPPASYSLEARQHLDELVEKSSR